jgi:hypothetical protein
MSLSPNLKRSAFLGLGLLQLLSLTACGNLPLVRVHKTVPQDIAARTKVLKGNHRDKINNLFYDGYFEIGEYAITRIKKDSQSSTASKIGP